MVSIRRNNLRWVDIEMTEIKIDELVMYYIQSNKAEGKSAWYNSVISNKSKDIGGSLNARSL